jgi:uncharacterized protein (PEP-CTERM system associated)
VLDYALNATHHSHDNGLGGSGLTAGGNGSDSLQHALNATLNAELVPSRVFVDATTTVSQQALSAYGQQSIDGTQANANRTELLTASLRPRAKGNLGPQVNYQFELNADGTHSQGAPAPYALATGAALTLGSSSGRALFGWTATLTEQRSRFSGAKASENQRGIVSAVVAPDPEFTGTVRGGRESYGVPGVYRQSYANWGVEGNWLPSPRTRLSAAFDKRYYGHSQQLLLDHRFQHASLRLSSSQGANDTGSATGVGQPQTLYQTYFNLPQFTSAQPDPVQREQLVRAFIKALGLNPDTLVGGGFVNGGATLQRRDDLSFTYSVRRINATVLAYSSSLRRISTSDGSVDPTAVRQRGLTASLSYRLTPISNLNAQATQLRTLGSDAQAGNDLKSVSLGWTTALNRSASAAVTARASQFHGAINPYRDTALSATLGLRF